MIAAKRKSTVSAVAEVPELVLPAWRLFGKRDDPPNRHHVIAECTITNEHGVTQRVRLAANWPQTRWYVSAIYTEHPTRASGAISTVSKKTATDWEAAIRAGRVRIAKS